MLQSSNFVISKVINPVLEKYTLVQNSETDVDEVQELKKLSDIAKSSKVVIQNFKYTGDLYKYIRSASKNNEAFSLFNKYNLTSFEDIFSEFEDNFKNEMNEVSSVSKLVVGNIYSTWDFVYLSDKYSARVPGILPVTSSSGKVTSVIARGNFSQDQKYQNKYISNEDIHYYLIGNINHKYNKFITVEKLPVHFFETVASNQQRYLGKYIYTKSYSVKSRILCKMHYVSKWL